MSCDVPSKTLTHPMHGSRLADLPFPTRIREELVTAGKAEPHHVLPKSGWVSRRIAGHHDVGAVVELFRLNYERSWTRGKDDSAVEAEQPVVKFQRRTEDGEAPR